MKQRIFICVLSVAFASAVLAAATLSPDDIQSAVNAAYAKYKNLQEGKNADYIPALAKVDPNLFGIAVVTVDGKTSTAGDVKTEVSIQSISKVFTMKTALAGALPGAAHGRPSVHEETNNIVILLVTILAVSGALVGIGYGIPKAMYGITPPKQKSYRVPRTVG